MLSTGLPPSHTPVCVFLSFAFSLGKILWKNFKQLSCCKMILNINNDHWVLNSVKWNVLTLLVKQNRDSHQQWPKSWSLSPHPQPQLTKETKLLGVWLWGTVCSTPSNQCSQLTACLTKLGWRCPENRGGACYTQEVLLQNDTRWQHHSNGNSALEDNTLCLALNRCPP